MGRMFMQDTDMAYNYILHVRCKKCVNKGDGDFAKRMYFNSDRDRFLSLSK